MGLLAARKESEEHGGLINAATRIGSHSFFERVILLSYSQAAPSYWFKFGMATSISDPALLVGYIRYVGDNFVRCIHY